MKLQLFLPVFVLLAGAAIAQSPAAPAPPSPVAPELPALPDLIPPDVREHLSDMKERTAEMRERADEMAARAAEKAMAASPFRVKPAIPDMLFAPQMKMRTQSRDRLYQSGQSAIDARRWDEAVDDFSAVAAQGGSRADGALYWKAYALEKLGRRDDALSSIAELRKSYPTSRWLEDAKALELEVKQASGPVSPESQPDEDLKLLAINGLMQSEPERALPLVEKILKSSQSPKVKQHALYVLAQSNLPRAQQLVEQYARGASNPDLQLEAITYFAEFKRRQGTSSPLLWEIYSSSNDANVKRTILSLFASARDKDHLLQAVKTEKSEDLRLDAISMLCGMSAQSDLWPLYQAETSKDAKRRMLGCLAPDRLMEVARSDKDAELRRYAIHSLANSRGAASDQVLLGLYASEQDPESKRAIIQSLHARNNAKALVELARKEQNADMKREIVRYLSNMKSPEATEYLMEILK